MQFTTKDAKNCRYDCVSLGEIMLRLDPGEGRIKSARQFNVWEGGGEYNVARGLKRCFGLSTAVATAFADNEIGKLLEDFVLQGGVDTSLIQWHEFDGSGVTVRNGLNFTERGFGIRGALGTVDRGHTAASRIKPGDIDWKQIFSHGLKWYHSGGIFAALSETTSEVIIEGMWAAKDKNTINSFDLNYREKLWAPIGGLKKAQQTLRQIVNNVDVLVWNEEDFQQGLGIPGPKATSGSKLETKSLFEMMEQVIEQFPNIKMVATTLREVQSANKHQWRAVLWYNGEQYVSPVCELNVLDRIGGGDGFASGFIYGLITGRDPEEALRLGWAHGALLTTFPGDTTMAKLFEVEAFAKDGSAKVQR